MLGTGALVSSCASYTFSSATKPSGLSTAAITQKINEARKANGRRPVAYNAKLAAAARNQALLMASRDELSHNLDISLRERVADAGYFGAVGENLAGGHQTLEAAIEGWLQSSGHRSTLLSSKFKEYGLSYARVSSGKKSRYGIYWVLIMGGDFSAWSG